MPFTLTLTDVPVGLTTDAFALRPITTADAARDYDAVMESRDYLRVWEQSSWPADDFTLDENRSDLDSLEQRHRDGLAYTYTVTDPADTVALGCVYLMHPSAKMYREGRITPLTDQRWEDIEATVHYWVRRSQLGEPVDRDLLAALRRWLGEDWPLGEHVFVTNQGFTQQMELFEHAGLERRFVIEEAGKQTPYLALS